MVDDAGVSLCVRDPDRPACARLPGEPLRDWFGPGLDEWSFWSFPSEAEYLDWHPMSTRWDRREWRKARHERRKA